MKSLKVTMMAVGLSMFGGGVAKANTVGIVGVVVEEKVVLDISKLCDETFLECMDFLRKAENACLDANEDIQYGLCVEAKDVLKIANEMMEKAFMACAWIPEISFDFADQRDEEVDEFCIEVEDDFEGLCE